MTVLLAGLLMATGAFAQPAVKVKKDQVYVNDSAVCRIEKKKKGFLEPVPDFFVSTLDKQPVAVFAHQSAGTRPDGEPNTWFRVTFAGAPDTVEIETKQFYAFHKNALLPKGEEALAGIIAKYGFFQNGAFSPEGAARFKKDYPVAIGSTYLARVAHERACIASFNEPVKSDAKQLDAVTVQLLQVDTIGRDVRVTYRVQQGETQLGTIIGEGTLKSFRSESAEFDFSGGIMNLDGETPLAFEVLNNGGCAVARYTGSEKSLTTPKDKVAYRYSSIKKYGPGNFTTRVEYLQAMAKLLVAGRYL